MLESIAMVIMLVTVYYRSCQKGYHSSFGCDQNKKILKHLLPLVAYPIIHILRFLNIYHRRSITYIRACITSPNYGLRIFSSTCFPISSLAAGLTLPFLACIDAQITQLGYTCVIDWLLFWLVHTSKIMKHNNMNTLFRHPGNRIMGVRTSSC